MKMRNLIAGSFVILLCSCAQDHAVNTNVQAKRLATNVCNAVLDYTKSRAQPDPELKRELSAIRTEKIKLDESGPNFGFDGIWRFDADQHTLTSSGYWIGNEHTWWIIQFEFVNSKPLVIGIKQMRETIKP